MGNSYCDWIEINEAPLMFFAWDYKTGWFQTTFPERQPVTSVKSWGLNVLDSTTSSWHPVMCSISCNCLALDGPKVVGELLERSLVWKKIIYFVILFS